MEGALASWNVLGFLQQWRCLQKVGGGTQQRDWAALQSCSRPMHPSHLLHLGSWLTYATGCGDLVEKSTYRISPKVHLPITCLWTCPWKYTWEQSVIKDKFIFLTDVCPGDHSLDPHLAEGFWCIFVLRNSSWTSSKNFFNHKLHSLILSTIKYIMAESFAI